MHSLVVQTSFLGDVILTTPLLAELALRGPVDVLTTPAGKTVLANNPAVRRILVFDKKRPGRVKETWKMARSLRDSVSAGPYETAYLAQGSLRSGAIAAFAGIPERVGFNTSPGRPFYTRTVDYPADRHHAERLLRLAGVMDAPQSATRPKLYPGASDRAAADQLLGTATGSFVVFAPGSAWGTKRWPHYPELARLLAPEMPVVVVGSSAEGGFAGEIEVAAPGKTLDATGELPVLASAEVIRRAAAIVTNDSAPLHLASAMNTPTLALFGPTVPEFGFGPLSDRKKSLGVEHLDCRPCDRHGPQRCPLGHWRCMRELSAGQVFEILQSMMSSPGSA